MSNLKASQVQDIVILENIALGNNDSVGFQRENIVPTGNVIARGGETWYSFVVYGVYSGYFNGDREPSGRLEQRSF